MTPADRIAELEAEVAKFRRMYETDEVMIALASAREEAKRYADAVAAMNAAALETEAVLSLAREEAKGLADALRECSQGVDDKGEPCWCCIPSMIPYRGHDAGCEAARAALKGKP